MAGLRGVGSDRAVYRKYISQIVVLYENREDVKIYSELLLSIGSVIIFGLFAIRPTLVTIIGLFNEIDQKEQTIVRMNSKIGSLIAAQTIFERERGRLNILGVAVPDQALPEGYIRQIEGMAKRNGVVIASVGTDGVSVLTQASGEQGDFTITMTVTGSYQNTSSFLTNLENARRPMLQEIAIAKINEGNVPGEVSITIEGRVPYMNPDI